MVKFIVIVFVFYKLLIAGDGENRYIVIHKGWQNLGASTDINVEIFKNKCVDLIWKYDSLNSLNPTWRLYVANGHKYNIPDNIKKLNFIYKNEGYWVLGNRECNISIPNGISGAVSKLVTKSDIANKKMQLLHRDKNWDVDYWMELYFSDNTFTGVYNDNIKNKYASNSEIRNDGIKISGSWDVKDGKIILTLTDKTIILTPINLDIENPIGFETFSDGKYKKAMFTIQNFY